MEMQTVELCDRHGGLVELVDIPEFKTHPDALVWGQRIFFYGEYDGKGQWREGYAYVIPPPRPDYYCTSVTGDAKCDLVKGHEGQHCKFQGCTVPTLLWS